MIVYLALMVAGFATAYLVIRLVRFLTSRFGLQEDNTASATDQQQAADGNSKPYKNALKPALVRNPAPVKRATRKTRADSRQDTVRKPWGW